MDLKKVWRLLHERRAVSPVVSEIILTGAVIVAGFAVLFWTQYRSSAYNEQYSEAMNADIARLKERLAFEYVFYDQSGNRLLVYLMNSGTIDGLTIQTVYIENSTWFSVFPKSQIDLKFLNGTSYPVHELDRGEEGYFVLSQVGVLSGKSYSVRIVTERGASFENSFVG